MTAPNSCSPDTIEAIITAAMAWHPSNTGPSYTETKNSLYVRFAALPTASDAVEGETAYALAFEDICKELGCDRDINAVLHTIAQLKAPALSSTNRGDAT